MITNVLLLTISELERRQSVLTRREEMVVQLVAEGHSGKAMANILGVSHWTVEAHRAAAMRLELQAVPARERARFFEGRWGDLNESALWTFDTTETHRVTKRPDLQRIIVAVDPSGTKAQTPAIMSGSWWWDLVSMAMPTYWRMPA